MTVEGAAADCRHISEQFALAVDAGETLWYIGISGWEGCIKRSAETWFSLGCFLLGSAIGLAGGWLLLPTVIPA